MLDITKCHPNWQPHLRDALQKMDQDYLRHLVTTNHWLPGKQHILNAFTLDLEQVNHILLGESPYPRRKSANGYAFWDAAVLAIWSTTGLSTQVNKATSLRNIIKMLLIAQGALTTKDTSQKAIANLNKKKYVQTLSELFTNFQQHGFLLLNASLVLSSNKVNYDAKFWQVFLDTLLQRVKIHRPHCQLILLGQIAKKVENMKSAQTFSQLCAEHPYNVSFISNPAILNFFKPFNLLLKSDEANNLSRH
jgi:uracil-DNA glycosylase